MCLEEHLVDDAVSIHDIDLGGREEVCPADDGVFDGLQMVVVCFWEAVEHEDAGEDASCFDAVAE